MLPQPQDGASLRRRYDIITPMRYIGSKDRLLPFIQQALDDHGAEGGTFCDAFSGTSVVASHAKARGYRVVANDLLFFSYVLQRAYLCCASPPRFERLPGAATGSAPEATWHNKLSNTIYYLNALPPSPGFVYEHYSPAGAAGRAYLSPENAGRIDAIRAHIGAWWDAGLLEGEEPYVLLAALIEAVPYVSNISGTYGAYLKSWDARALKPLTLRVPEIVPTALCHRAHHGDATALVADVCCDVLYLDPPYNSRPYASNYHLLETIARYDMPQVHGKTGLRRDEDRSAYNAAAPAAAALRVLVGAARCTHLLLSYNSEGLIPEAEIMDILSTRGNPEVRRQPYRRFRSAADGPGRRYAPQAEVSENLYYVRCDA
ncbi:MAG TPA: DNA adenine methylase [Chloroflexia bacterium]|nr:DNA adenine methylase [Chloroflexia bacterium]